MIQNLIKFVSGLVIVSFLACSDQKTNQIIPLESELQHWSLDEISVGDIRFMKKKLSFEFDSLDYGIYAQIDPIDEERFQTRCESLIVKTDTVKRLITEAKPISEAEGAHGYDRGIDHCGLSSSVFIKNGVYDLAISAFGVGVLWPAAPNGEAPRYFLTRNCDHSRDYIEWYFEKTGHHPGLHESDKIEDVLAFFCEKAP